MRALSWLPPLARANKCHSHQQVPPPPLCSARRPRSDVRQHCKDVVPGSARVIGCLGEHRADLSKQCAAKLFEHDQRLAGERGAAWPSRAAEPRPGPSQRCCAGGAPGCRHGPPCWAPPGCRPCPTPAPCPPSLPPQRTSTSSTRCTAPAPWRSPSSARTCRTATPASCAACRSAAGRLPLRHACLSGACSGRGGGWG